MTSGTFFWLTNVNCTSWWEKKNGPRLVVFLQSVYGRERKKYKNKRYLLTFRVGNAISTAASRALANVRAVTADKVPTVCVPPQSPKEGKHSGHSCGLLLSPGLGLGPTDPCPPGKRHRTWQFWAHAFPSQPCSRAGTRPPLPRPGGHTKLTLSLLNAAPAAICSAGKSLAVLTNSDKIHFIGFAL